MTILHDWPEKAISVRQPWAWLICNFTGAGKLRPKRIENRPTLKNIKGTHFIHAGSRFDFPGYRSLIGRVKSTFDTDTAHAFFRQLPSLPEFNPMLGGIVGWAHFKGEFVTESDDFWFVPGQNGLLIASAGALPFQRCSGKLSVFTVEYLMGGDY